MSDQYYSSSPENYAANPTSSMSYFSNLSHAQTKRSSNITTGKSENVSTINSKYHYILLFVYVCVYYTYCIYKLYFPVQMHSFV